MPQPEPSSSPQSGATDPRPSLAIGRPLLWALLLLLPAGIFARGCPADCQCNQPQTVFCIGRRIHAIPPGLPQDTTSLYMFENGIRSLSRDSFLGLPALQLLDLSQNLLSSLPQNVFQPLTGIYNLDLSSNQLREISNESFHGLRWLERLYLDHNRLEFIHPAAFDTLEHLLELKLQDNRLQAMPPLRLPTLLLLDISRNGIAALEPAAFHVRNLESLKIAGLGLRSLPEQLLQDLQNLHELDLSDNLLAAVPGALKRLHGLTKLSLAGNAQIAQLHLEDFRELRSLQELDISNLNLNGLPRDFFSAFPRLRGVTAAENPFNCVCQMSWFISWASSSGASLRRPEETRCHFPPKNAGRLLQALEYVDFGCPTTTTTTRPTTTLKATSPKLPPALPSVGRVPVEPGTGGTTPGASSPPPTPDTALHDQPSPEGGHLCPPHTCLNGGACRLDPLNHVECVCPGGFTGPYCETGAQATTPPAAPTLAPTRPAGITIQHVGTTSLRVGLQNYIRARTQLKGLRLTYRNLSGPDKRPVTLSLPASLPDYTVRALKPNCSYHLCVGPLGGQPHSEDQCVEARTLPLTHQQHAPVTQGKDAGLTLALVPALAAVLLLVAAAAALSYFVRQRRRRRGQKAPTAPGASGVGPLELEGVKAGLEKAEPTGPGHKAGAAPNGLEYEVPLMPPPPQASSAATPRTPGPSYF
ncbi:LOW QUALITY PROTEIN: vasorin [Varanus komodoensis]|uniref:LOW QUALITY PROTEIN: vasorin n=1 Tax=Varanus komodoensis TaxID=61221 RepID=UPI001CF7CFCE|nr:LOW QUALITY PROTEIN: vasorin [Varanus komodoensis]